MFERHATIDFETRSALELKKSGAFKYAMDVSTRALCLAYKFPGQDEPRIWKAGEPVPADLFFWIEDGGVVEAHNAEFEFVIWNYCMRKNGWPSLPLNQLRCSAAKAAALNLPRGLDGLCEVLDTEVKKDKEGHKIMLRVSRLKRPTKRDQENFDDDPAKLSKLYSYCIDDVLAEEGASRELYPLTQREQKFWEWTTKINDRGIYCDVELCRVGFEFAKRFERDLQAELKIVTKGAVRTAKQVAATLEFLKTQGVILPNLQAKTVEAVLTKPEALGPAALRVLQIRAQLAKSSVSKFTKMIEMAGPDNRIRGTLMFHGGSTGRDAGKGIQPQNYPRGNVKNVEPIIDAMQAHDYAAFKAQFPNVFQSLSNALRAMLRSAPGRVLVSADYSAIEARVLFWLAEHRAGLDLFYRDEDPYVDMAASIYAIAHELVSLDQRQLGKQAILGLGFGMGFKKFAITCQGYNMKVDEAFSKKVVNIYRTKHWPVPALWSDLERAAIRAVQVPGRVIPLKRLKLFVKGRFLFIQLPSGRRLAYRDPVLRKEDRGWGEQDRLGYYAPHAQTKQWVYEETYGGKLTENVVQAIARDILFEAGAKCEMAGFPIVMRVHDELVAEIPEEMGDVQGIDPLKEFEFNMSYLAPWAEGYPMAVKGWIGERYRKA